MTYQWMGPNGEPDGHEVCIDFRGGAYFWQLSERLFPGAPSNVFFGHRTAKGALRGARRAIKRYRRPFT